MFDIISKPLKLGENKIRRKYKIRLGENMLPVNQIEISRDMSSTIVLSKCIQ